MKINLKWIILCISALYSLYSYAQEPVEVTTDEPNKLVIVSKDKAGNEVIRILDESKATKFNEHNTPRFLLTSRSNNFALGVGGYLRADLAYDFKGIVNDASFNTAKISLPGSTGVRNQFQIDFSHTTLFVKLVGKTKQLGDIVAYVNGNFGGDNYTFKLHNAYVQFMNILIGYNFGHFMDLEADAPTIDHLGPCGMVNYRIIQLSYTYNKLKHWEFSGAIEMPTVGATYSTTMDGYKLLSSVQRVPNFTANIQYGWGKRSQVRVAGLVRSMTYESEHNNQLKAHSKLGWGVQLSTLMGICQPLKVFAQATYGRGIGSFIKDLNILKIDLVPDLKDPNKMQALPMLGWYAGAQFNFNPNVFISATYSQCRIYRENGWPITNSDFFKKGQYLVTNLFWDAVPYLRTGVEYVRGWRTGFDNGSTRHANRINVLMQYNF